VVVELLVGRIVPSQLSVSEALSASVGTVGKRVEIKGQGNLIVPHMLPTGRTVRASYLLLSSIISIVETGPNRRAACVERRQKMQANYG
jgi:hypothetical protein